MVARLSFARNDTVELYVNLPLGGQAPEKPSVAHVASKDCRLISNSLVLWGGKPVRGAFNEIRIGESYTAVTPAS